MKKFVALLAAVMIGLGGTAFDADAASKKKKGKFTEQQLKQIRNNAMATCRKRFGQGVVLRATFDVRANRYICYTN